MDKRNRAFDALKVIMVLIVVLHHSGMLSGVLRRGYMAVEFFFIVSGYLLAKTQQSHPEMSAAQYAKRRLFALYPGYFFAYLCMAAVLVLRDRYMRAAPWDPLLEILLLQNVGLPGGGGLNYPLWYLSVLMTAGTLLFLLLRRLPRRAASVLCAAVIAAVYAAHIASGGIEHWENVLLVLYPPFWRGMADLMIGVLIFRLQGSQLYRAAAPHAPRLSTAALIAVLALMCVPGPGLIDFAVLAAIIVLVFACACGDVPVGRMTNSRVCAFLVRHEYAIFLHHAMFIELMREASLRLNLPWVLYPVLLLIGLPLFAAAADRLTQGVMGMLRRKRTA